MKSPVKFKHLTYLLFITIVVMLLQSCVVSNPYYMRSVPVSDIVQMSKDGFFSKDIIKELRSSHSVYLLKADQLAKLKSEGVQDSVINYMEKTHMDAIRQNQKMEDSYYWWPGMFGYGYYGLGLGWPYLSWGLNLGPTIIIRGDGGYGGRFHGGVTFHGGVRH